MTDIKEETTIVLGTEALLVKQLKKGLYYRCLLSGDRKVQYAGEGAIKWWSEPIDDYKYADVLDYQLAPYKP